MQLDNVFCLFGLRPLVILSYCFLHHRFGKRAMIL